MNHEEHSCGGGCGSCGSGCNSEQRGPSFFDRMESVSEKFDEIGEENILNMLNEAVAEWEEEDK